MIITNCNLRLTLSAPTKQDDGVSFQEEMQERFW